MRLWYCFEERAKASKSFGESISSIMYCWISGTRAIVARWLRDSELNVRLPPFRFICVDRYGNG